MISKLMHAAMPSVLQQAPSPVAEHFVRGVISVTERKFKVRPPLPPEPPQLRT